ncbi:Na+/H+ antiporter subunit E [Thermococcus sp.]|uniref:Na+/H+ antiporter subunit E n=1 Tax=Thermococcus sp. TaxID=35749 RepID=UPI002625AA8D|nr:Na+/H+ antiporter subunit E [Thermococcus sp.]
MRGTVSTTVLVFLTYILFTGSLTPYDIVTGVIAAAVVGALVGRFLVKNDAKAFSPIRWVWGLAYFLWYFLVAEVRAHLDVIRRIITGKVEPGIVRVPLGVKDEYARALVANSITNTPGTVVVDVDGDFLYVNWISVATKDPIEAKKEICEDFERFARRIFE